MIAATQLDRSPALTASTPRARAPQAVRAGVVGNYVDQLHIFLPLAALTPVLPVIAGTDAIGAAAAIVMVATLLGRPLGAVVFGLLADRFGRTRTTRIAILGTAAMTAAVGLVPTVDVLGPLTMVIIVTARFLGGVFLAGEYTAAIPLAMEWSAAGERGRWSGRIMAAAPLAQASIAGAVALATLLLGPDGYAAWGWRGLFLAGAAASIAVYVRYSRSVRDAGGESRGAAEAPSTTAVGAPAPAPVSRDAAPALAADPIRVPARGIRARFAALFLLMTGLWFLTQIVVIQLTGVLGSRGLDAGALAVVIVTAALAQAAAMAAAGALSDRIGRARVEIGFAISSAVLVTPLWLLATGEVPLAIAALASAALQAGTVAAYGPVGAQLAEAFPARVRSTGYGTVYSASLIVPALHPFYLPVLEAPLGSDGARIALALLGASCLAVGALALHRTARR